MGCELALCGRDAAWHWDAASCIGKVSILAICYLLHCGELIIQCVNSDFVRLLQNAKWKLKLSGEGNCTASYTKMDGNYGKDNCLMAPPVMRHGSGTHTISIKLEGRIGPFSGYFFFVV